MKIYCMTKIDRRKRILLNNNISNSINMAMTMMISIGMIVVCVVMNEVRIQMHHFLSIDSNQYQYQYKSTINPNYLLEYYSMITYYWDNMSSMMIPLLHVQHVHALPTMSFNHLPSMLMCRRNNNRGIILNSRKNLYNYYRSANRSSIGLCSALKLYAHDDTADWFFTMNDDMDDDDNNARNHESSSSSSSSSSSGQTSDDGSNGNNNIQQQRPTPSLPSQYFLTLATSQFELMANSLKFDITTSSSSKSGSLSSSKVKQAALYLPQENAKSGQLEFLPMMIYPNPVGERIFIANQIGSGLPPHMPKVLTKLPGFQDAKSLIPMYPFVTRSQDGYGSEELVASGCGTVEEVLCDPTGETGAALSVPMFIGSQTVGVVLVWPNDYPTRSKRRKSSSNKRQNSNEDDEECVPSIWSEEDKTQISRVAYSLSMALMMDRERSERETEVQVTQMQVEQLRLVLADNLHQIKNPLQALRAFGKLLQRKVALEEELGPLGKVTPLRSLADNMIIQSDRVIDLLLPMDSLLAALEPDSSSDFYLIGKEMELLKQGRGTSEGFQINGSRESSVIVNNNNSTTEYQPIMRSGRPTMTRKSDRFSPYTGSMSLGDFDFKMIFLADYIQPILEAETVIASERGIRLDVIGDKNDELPGVLICPKSLQECITNLIDNAIKYVTVCSDGSSNTCPRIRVSLFPNEPPAKPGATIFIEDNGPGIPESERDLVFSRTYRGSIKELVPNGDGIGLSVCKSMILRMGGSVEVIDRGQYGLGGTSMRVTLYRKPDVSLSNR